jgi:dihydropteroate synthase
MPYNPSVCRLALDYCSTLETYTMLARLFPQDNRALMARELAAMGHQEPDALLGRSDQEWTWKLMDVPSATATLFTTWLAQQAPQCWWYSTSGATATTVDLLFRCPRDLYTALCLAAPHTPGLQSVLKALEHVLQLHASAPASLLLGDTPLQLQRRVYVMGVLNVTPDSFSDGGLYLQPEQAIKHAEEMLAEGADLIDVGGQSSRPGARPVPAAVEQQRVVPVVQEIVKRYGALVSVDTYRASVAAAALDVGAVLINDISALRFDAHMAPLLARRNAAVVLMHMQGTPQNMQQAPAYRHVIDDIYSFFAERLHYARQHGIAPQRLLLDPGIGFGKTVQHNLEVLHGLEYFQSLGAPLLVGTSRKSFLGYLLQRKVWDRLEGTLTSVIYAVLRGATMVRVHDVQPVVQAVRLLDALQHPTAPLS